jgi:hypothetical protein
MKKRMLLAALAASALMAGGAEAATIFSQNFNGGLGGNESVGGNFAVGDGNVGHQTTYYSNDEYSYYQVRLDLTQALDALLVFDFDILSEHTWDGFNLAYSTDGTFSRDNLLMPMTAGLYDRFQGRANTLLGAQGISGQAKGRGMFDLNAFAGQVVDIRFQFASDRGVIGQGVAIDNLVVTGTVPSAVPEPATWALMIAGFGMAGGAIRARRRVGELQTAG